MWKKKQIFELRVIAGIKLLLVLGMLTMFITSSDQVLVCSLPTFYSVLGLLCYIATGFVRDLAGILAFNYLVNTKRVAKIFSCLTIGSEIAMVMPGIVALIFGLVILRKDDTCTQ